MRRSESRGRSNASKHHSSHMVAGDEPKRPSLLNTSTREDSNISLIRLSSDSDISLSSKKTSKQHHRSSGLIKNPMATYNNEVVDTVLNHDKIVQYRTGGRPGSVSMDCHDLVPAFNDLTIDLEEGMNGRINEKYAPGSAKASSVLEDFDNHFSRPHSVKSASVKTGRGSSFMNQEIDLNGFMSDVLSEDSSVEKGRIQQRIQYLKTLHEKELSSEKTRPSQLSVEQKVALEFVKRQLRSLRRYNAKPMLSAVERTHESVPGAKNIAKSGPKSSPRDAGRVDAAHAKNETRKRVVALFSKGSELSNELWRDFHEKSSVTSLSTNGTLTTDNSGSLYRAAGTAETSLHLLGPSELARQEADAIKDSFHSFRMSTGHGQGPGTSPEASLSAAPARVASNGPSPCS